MNAVFAAIFMPFPGLNFDPYGSFVVFDFESIEILRERDKKSY